VFAALPWARASRSEAVRERSPGVTAKHGDFMEAPQVSVVIPAYNRERLIQETLRSVAAQTYRSFEVIVVDDGSTDRTADVARETLRSLDLEGTVATIENSGPDFARDRGVAHARGRLIALLDSDDLWDPGFLARLERELARNPDAGIAFCDFTIFHDDGRPDRRKTDTLQLLQHLVPVRSSADSLVLRDGLFAYLLEEQPFFMSCVLLRRSLYDAVGSMTSLLGRQRTGSSEWEFLLRCSRQTSFVLVLRALSRIRRHSGNLSASPWQLQGEVEVLRVVLARYALDSEERRIVIDQISRRALDLGRHYLSERSFERAQAQFLESIYARPSTEAAVLGLLSSAPALFDLARAGRRIADSLIPPRPPASSR
jgi:hypothetical protein